MPTISRGWSSARSAVTPVAILLFSLAGCDGGSFGASSRADVIAAEVDSVMNPQLDLWYPRVVDREHGGFLSRFDYKWEPEGSQDKMIVTQSRHI